MKYKCRHYYNKLIQSFPDDTEAGFIGGQCEKVMMGACLAMMQFTTQSKAERIAGIYDLLHTADERTLDPTSSRAEIWFFRQKNTSAVFGMLDHPVDSELAHLTRAVLCGVPLSDVDLDFHERAS